MRGKAPTNRRGMLRGNRVANNTNLGSEGTPWEVIDGGSLEREPEKNLLRTRSGRVVLRPSTEDNVRPEDAKALMQMPYTTSLFVDALHLMKEYHAFQNEPTLERKEELKYELTERLSAIENLLEAHSKDRQETGRITYALDRRSIFRVPTLVATHWNDKPPLVGENRPVVEMPDGTPYQNAWSSLGMHATYARDMHLPKLKAWIEKTVQNQEFDKDEIMTFRVDCSNWGRNETSTITRILSEFEGRDLTLAEVKSYWRA